jgi:hypothetical protein
MTTCARTIGRSADREMAGPGDDALARCSLRFAAPPRHPEEAMSSPTDRGTDVLRRTAPLAGVLFAGLSIGGELVIDAFPEGATSPSRLQAYYAAHAAQVSLGGALLVAAAVCFAVFAASLADRLRGRTPAVLTALVVVGAAVELDQQFTGAATYRLLADLGTDRGVAPAALQAWHIAGSDYFTAGGVAVLLLGVAAAGLAYRAVPRWLAGAGLLVAVALFTPVAFEASQVFLVWAAVAGIALAVRPSQTSVPVRAAAVPATIS